MKCVPHRSSVSWMSRQPHTPFLRKSSQEAPTGSSLQLGPLSEEVRKVLIYMCKRVASIFSEATIIRSPRAEPGTHIRELRK